MADIKVTVKQAEKKRKREIQLNSHTTIAHLLQKLGHSREAVVVKRNGKIVAEEEHLCDGDLIEILTIVTGG